MPCKVSIHDNNITERLRIGLFRSNVIAGCDRLGPGSFVLSFHKNIKRIGNTIDILFALVQTRHNAVDVAV